ncbi:MAG: HEAT repeat domain-containing protein [Planctomycetes bacterium]|nr:HEAT repeat domain-containing protein [Planctomycetota bacterium]
MVRTLFFVAGRLFVALALVSAPAAARFRPHPLERVDARTHQAWAASSTGTEHDALEAAYAFAPAVQAPSEAEIIKEIKAAGDAIKPERIKDLANCRTRSAMQALLEMYASTFSTIFMKREVVRALVKFDGVADAEQPALQKMMDVATQSKEIELRTAAIDALGECGVHGKDFLVLVIESAAEDMLRERAMTAHLRLHDKADLDWYKLLYKPKKDDDDDKNRKGGKPAPKPPKKDPKKDKDKEPEEENSANKKGRPINPLRFMAFEALASNMTPDELLEATKDGFHKIRFKAMEELDRRSDKKVRELAERVMKTDGDMPANRVLGAQIVAKADGPKCADDLIKIATQQPTPLELRRGIADIVVGWNDDKLNKQMVNDLTRGKEWEKLFYIAALAKVQDKRVSDGLEHLLADKEVDVVVNAAKTIAERGQKESIDKLTKMIGKGKERNAMRAALDALTVLRRGDAAWIDDLIGFTKHDDPEVRNLALQALGQTKEKKALEKLVAALNDENWSVRLAALDALEHLKTKEAIGPIIERMAKEEGRMLQEFSLALWRLTGQGFQENAGGWSNWWKGAADKFEFLTEEQLNQVKSGEEEYRLKQTTRVEQKFFGIRIISHRVIFIIDVSGSMQELLNSEYEGKTSQPRMEVAKRELERCVTGLDTSAFFNIVTFSSDVDRWVDGTLSVANEKNRGAAKEYVGKLMAAGGTNLYGAVKDAFKDLDVDTIFILSDGEPSVGEETDPTVIREHVKAWNEHRGIQINTIAVGGQFQILEWLAQDSGGTHVSFD